MNWFTRVVAYHPYYLLLAVGVFSTTCLIIPLVTKKLPDFQDPQLGFEARGNDIGQRLTALRNLEEETRPSGSLVLNPQEFIYAKKLAQKKTTALPETTAFLDNDFSYTSPNFEESVISNLKTGRKKLVNGVSNFSVVTEENHRNKTIEDEEWDSLRSDLSTNFNQPHSEGSENFFCGMPSASYAHLVVATALNSDLLSLHAVQEICRFQEYLTNKPEFKDICETDKWDNCCPIWSVPNYLTILYNHSTCHEITMDDIYSLVEMLETCAPFYYNLELTTNHEVSNVPQECTNHNAAYALLHFLIDIDFLPAKQKSGDLKSTMMFLPIARSSSSIPFYEKIDTKELNLRAIKLVAVDFGLKNLLFDKYLIRDLWLVAAGSGFILLCIWIYTHSVLITFMTVIAVVFSLAIGYFVYTLILGLNFFPFMNILAAVVAIGIGSDDAFILCKVWRTFKVEKPDQSIALLTHNILRHCSVALLVTAVTTCAAFFSSYITTITSIKCFSIFAGVSVAANFFLMLTWLPASIVTVERWNSHLKTSQSPLKNLHFLNLELSNFRFLLENYLIKCIIKLRYLFILVFGIIGILSVIIVFHYPKLKLPETADFQLFQVDHPFEQYELFYKEKFWFERLLKGDSWENPTIKMPLQFVWGVLPIDSGDYLDPLSRGKIHFDPSFDISDAESQAWLLRFCRQLKNQTFYEPTLGPLLSNCFIESFIRWMSQRCVDPVDNESRAPCCESEHFPYSKKVFSICIKRAIESLYRTPQEYVSTRMAGPKFSKKGKNHIKAIVVEYESNVFHSTSFVKMHQFFKEVETWTKKMMNEAPPGMRNGWFISELEFYNLQLTLAQDTLISIAVSMIIAFIVLLFVTLNIMLSVLAIITVSFIIFVTVAYLVLIGWQLNVLESVAMNVAIGLAVDFSLHYAVNYRLCPTKNCRVTCVTHSISMMGGPTIMAALTSGAAGAFMLLSEVLPYRQIGIFLLDVMTVSWVYSTFFLMPLLSLIGPENDFGQFTYPNIKVWLKNTFRVKHCQSKNQNIRKSFLTNILSDSPFSVSSTTSDRQTSTGEAHELDALHHSKSNKKCLQNKSKRKVSMPADQSPSAVSSVTIIHDDDSEHFSNNLIS